MTLVREKSDVRQAIERTWTEMMPFAVLADESITWRDTGADSFLTLQFLLRLEQLLDRPLSFDMFTLDMTVGDVIRAIEQSQTANPTIAKPVSIYPTLFLIPALHGDEPILAEFRRSMAKVLHIETLELPDLAHKTSVLSSIPATAAFLVRQINQKQPSGPIFVAGYSIGGMFAFEAAHQLKSAGRDVRFVCLLDTLYGPRIAPPGAMQDTDAPADAGPRPLLSRLKRKPAERLPLYLDRLVLGALLRLGLVNLARMWTVATARQNTFLTNDKRRKHIIWITRGRSILSWRPHPWSGPVLLISSDDFEKTSSLVTWTTLCSNLTVQKVRGGHREIFAPTALAKLRPALLAALDRARDGAASTR